VGSTTLPWYFALLSARYPDRKAECFVAAGLGLVVEGVCAGSDRRRSLR